MTLATLDGHRVIEARLMVPSAGHWLLDTTLDAAPSLEGAAQAKLGDLTLRGRIVPSHSGTWQLGARYRLIGGLGWRSEVPERHYHSDAGIKHVTIASQAASEVGEAVSVAPELQTVSVVAFSRRKGPAGDVLRQLFAGAWWVDFGGVTRAGTRPDIEAASDYQVLDFDPRNRSALLATETLSTIQIGTILRHRLDQPLRVSSYVVTLTAKAVRVQAWGAAA